MSFSSRFGGSSGGSRFGKPSGFSSSGNSGNAGGRFLSSSRTGGDGAATTAERNANLRYEPVSNLKASNPKAYDCFSRLHGDIKRQDGATDFFDDTDNGRGSVVVPGGASGESSEFELGPARGLRVQIALLRRVRRALLELKGSSGLVRREVNGLKDRLDRDVRHREDAEVRLRNARNRLPADVRYPSQAIHEFTARARARSKLLGTKVDELEAALLPAGALRSRDGHDGNWRQVGGVLSRSDGSTVRPAVEGDEEDDIAEGGVTSAAKQLKGLLRGHQMAIASVAGADIAVIESQMAELRQRFTRVYHLSRRGGTATSLQGSVRMALQNDGDLTSALPDPFTEWRRAKEAEAEARKKEHRRAVFRHQAAETERAIREAELGKESTTDKKDTSSSGATTSKFGTSSATGGATTSKFGSSSSTTSKFGTSSATGGATTSKFGSSSSTSKFGSSKFGAKKEDDASTATSGTISSKFGKSSTVSTTGSFFGPKSTVEGSTATTASTKSLGSAKFGKSNSVRFKS